MFKWFQNQFFIFPFLQFFPLIIDYIFATTALWRSGLCIEIKLSSYAFDISNNKILITFGNEMLVFCWRSQSTKKYLKKRILKKAKILLIHDLGLLGMFCNHFSFDFTLCVSLQWFLSGFMEVSLKLPFDQHHQIVLCKGTEAGKIIEGSKLLNKFWISSHHNFFENFRLFELF